MDIAFDIVKHEFMGEPIVFSIPFGQSDEYLQRLRNGDLQFQPLSYFFFRSNELGRKLRIVDVGANIGAVAIPLSAHGHSVLAIEADVVNFASLISSKLHGEIETLLPVHMAAFRKPELVYLEGGGAWGQIRTQSDFGDRVLAMPLSDIMRTFSYDDADLVKIDIEGSELGALAGIESLIAENPEIEFVYESNSSACHEFGYDTQELAKLFERNGFNIYVFRTDDLMEWNSNCPQATRVSDNLATRRDLSSIQYMPVRKYDAPWTELELRKSLVRDAPSHQDHALRQIKYCRPEFVAGHDWQGTLAYHNGRFRKT